MKKVRATVGIGAVVVFCCAWAFAGVATTNAIKGTVQEVGFGKFTLQEKSGTSWLFYLSNDGTSYTPDDWRPVAGDEVAVTRIEVERRGNAISQAVTVALTKIGPNTVRIKSPVAVEIVETGKTGYRAKIVSSGKVVKFSNQRSTKVVPVGWIPTAGEKATMTFAVQSATVFSMAFSGPSGITYVLDKVEKVETGAKAK